MERLTGKDAKLMMEALAAVYEKKGDCIDKDKKTKHNCATKVCSEQWGEGTCVPEHHTLLEDGTVTHYDVVFEHGLERMVPIQELKVINDKVHEHAEMEGEVLDENRNRRGAAARANRQAKAAEQDRLYRAGGGDAKMRQGPQGSRRRFGGTINRSDVIAQGKKNLDAKGATSTGTAPAAPANSAVASRTPAAPAKTPAAPVKNSMANASKEDRMAAWAKANPKLAAAKAKRDAARGTSASSNPMMKDMKSRMSAPKTGSGNTPAPAGAAVGAAIKPGANAAGSLKPGAAAANAAARASTAAGKMTPAAGKPTPAVGKPTPAVGKPTPAVGKPTPAVGKPAPTLDAAKVDSKGNRQADLFTGKANPGYNKSDKLKKPLPKPGTPAAKNAPDREEVLFHYNPFDAIKGYLMSEEGYSEDEALMVMTVLTDEERTEIIEGSCGSKKKKKSKKGGY